MDIYKCVQNATFTKYLHINGNVNGNVFAFQKNRLMSN